jgi:hypothetical protein
MGTSTLYRQPESSGAALGQDAGRCRSVCSARKGSPCVTVVWASNDDCPEVTRILKIENIYRTNLGTGYTGEKVSPSILTNNVDTGKCDNKHLAEYRYRGKLPETVRT